VYRGCSGCCSGSSYGIATVNSDVSSRMQYACCVSAVSFLSLAFTHSDNTTTQSALLSQRSRICFECIILFTVSCICVCLTNIGERGKMLSVFARFFSRSAMSLCLGTLPSLCCGLLVGVTTLKRNRLRVRLVLVGSTRGEKGSFNSL